MIAITNRLHNSFKIKDNSLEIDFFCVSKLSIDLFFKLLVSRFLAINIEGKIGQLTVRRTSSFTSNEGTGGLGISYSSRKCVA
jgi:hypothetical protein